MTPVDCKEMAATIRRDPERGFRLLWAAWGKSLYWHVRRLVVAHDDAEDVVQETLVRAFSSFGKIKDDTQLRTWIYRIATNEALRLIDGRKRRGVQLDTDDAAMANLRADDYVDYSDLEAVRLQRAILSLPAKQRLTFNLRYYDEMDYGEIAAITGTNAAAAKANYHVAKDKIVKYMNSND